ncbi:MAG: hypothetical protein A2Z16_11525 [Chloroflexi bacterium RBG_16_54_18]|nr:MAG: hypothetical protein A2Z16_11525 [Chloroflexi bacterium RBG_16_54_18]
MAGLVQKLGLREGQLICLLDAPIEASHILLAVLPCSVIIHNSLEASNYDLILVWPMQLQGLAQFFARLQAHLQPAGAIWAIMPKQKFARQRGIDYSWNQLQAAALTTDLVDNKTASFNEQDYATRFVIRKLSRAKAL